MTCMAWAVRCIHIGWVDAGTKYQNYSVGASCLTSELHLPITVESSPERPQDAVVSI